MKPSALEEGVEFSVFGLKVHKRENFLDFDFEISVFSQLIMHKCYGFVKKKFRLDHYWGRQDYSAYTQTRQNKQILVSQVKCF